MFKLMCLVVSCFNNTDRSTEPIYLDYPLSSEYSLVTVQEYDLVYHHYAPLILKQYGTKIAALITQHPEDERSQFIKRYIKTVIHKLSLVPINERDKWLSYILVKTPSSEKERHYIYDIKDNVPPTAIAKIGTADSHLYKEFTTKINSIKAQL